MTVTEPFQLPTADTVAVDLYRDIHKGIRAVLGELVVQAGSTDPDDRAGRVALALAVADAVELLESHAHHEDEAIGPVLESHLPDLAARIARDHEAFDGRTAYLVAFADAFADVAPVEARRLGHHLYLDLAGFTSAYLAHQDVEEREVMPALEATIGIEATAEIHRRIVGSIPPDEMARSLAVMLPAMQIDDRAELLGGMQAGAPPEVFAGVWGLAGSVLTPEAHARLALRLGLA
jgi:hypothetical protein